MLINIKTKSGYVLVNTDNVDSVFFNRSEERLYVNRHRGDTQSYGMNSTLIDETIKIINKKIGEENNKTNTD